MKPATYDKATQIWTQTLPHREFYSVQEVNTILHSGGPSVRNSIKRGTLKGYRVGGFVKVKHDDLIAYIARRGMVTTVGYGDLVIEEIIPTQKRSQAAVAAELAAELTGDDLSFLDETEVVPTG